MHGVAESFVQRVLLVFGRYVGREEVRFESAGLDRFLLFLQSRGITGVVVRVLSVMVDNGSMMLWNQKRCVPNQRVTEIPF